MKTVQKNAYARAGLLGNPSDGYNGKALSFAVLNFCAEVGLVESEVFEFESASGEVLKFGLLSDRSTCTEAHRRNGGLRLLQSAWVEFNRYFSEKNFSESKPFRIRFQSSIPREVGLAGSSAIVIAALRCFCEWFDVAIPPHLLASVALAAEHNLGFQAGLQDRVVQSYQGVVYMDFSRSAMQIQDGLPFGKYETIDLSKLPNLYIAYCRSAAESTNVLHGDLRARYEAGDQQVISTLKKIASLAEAGKRSIELNDLENLAMLIDQNFDLRSSICTLNPMHAKMVEVARLAGATAKFCGSGGAIVGTYHNENRFGDLKKALAKIGVEVIKPIIG